MPTLSNIFSGYITKLILPVWLFPSFIFREVAIEALLVIRLDPLDRGAPLYALNLSLQGP